MMNFVLVLQNQGGKEWIPLKEIEGMRLLIKSMRIKEEG
jgi:hypothetical protein